MLNNLKERIPNSTKRKIKRFLINCIDSLRYKLECCEFPRSSDIYAKKIIFICKGNVCRSAFAEYSMKKLTRGTQITVQSCGLKVNQGKYPPQEAIEIANKYSCDLSMHISKSIDSCNINEADLIIPMEYNQYRDLIQSYPDKKKQIILLRNVAGFPLSLFCNIDDPFGSDIMEFNKTFKLISFCLGKLVDRLHL